MFARWAATLVFVAPVAFGQANSSEAGPASKFRWFSSCDQANAEPWFEVDLFADRSGTYNGKSPLKEIGHRNLEVSSGGIRAIARAAQRAIREKPAAPNPAVVPLPIDYCIGVRLTPKSEVLVPVTRTASRPVRKLVDLLEEELRLKRLVCPLRGGGSRTPFYAPFYCELPALNVSFADDRDCYGMHVVNFYPDGLTHYYATDTKQSLRSVVRTNVGDQFARVTADVVRRLYDQASGFTLQPPITDEPIRTPAGDIVRGRGSDEELRTFRDEVGRVANIDWMAIPNPVSECASRVTGAAVVYRRP